MTTTAAPPARRRAPMGRTGRRVALAVHLWSAGAWIGLDLALGALVLTSLTTDDPGRRAACYQVLEVIAVGPLPVAGLVCLASGVVLGLGAGYGLLRWWWVAVKLVVTVVLSVLVLALLGPDTRELAEQGRELAAGGTVGTDVPGLVMPPVVTVVALTFAVYLSVAKPWGRTPWSRPARGGPAG